MILINTSNNYGPYQFPEKLIPLMTLAALEGKPLPVYGKGDQVRDWLFVEDHARALDLILAEGEIGETYMVGGRGERTNLEVVQSICDIVDEVAPRAGVGPRRELITYVEDRPGHDVRYAIDASKIERTLGWRPETSFEAGLERTVRWYLEREDWWGPLREQYAGQRLGRVTAG